MTDKEIVSVCMVVVLELPEDLPYTPASDPSDTHYEVVDEGQMGKSRPTIQWLTGR